MYWRYLLVTLEVLGITLLNYWMAGTYYSFEVLYCLPIIQTAHLSSLRARRSSDKYLADFFGILSAVVWSLGEAAIAWPDFPMLALGLNIFTRSVTLAVLGRVMTKLWRDRAYSRKDALTELANRLALFDRLEIEQTRSMRSGHPYSLMFIDIDQFKRLNDNQGHHTGDAALKVLAHVLLENSRTVDTVCRFGGDEFVLLFPETDEEGCSVLSRRISSAAALEFWKKGWPISVSIGYTTEIGKNRSADELLRAADQKMYLLKKARQ
ncbi:MAG TPA: GGDEF domain-containing protein [Methylophilaceae bacterium]|nr:GGDEF domain-containing protein [Methylophilaceae bacterium]